MSVALLTALVLLPAQGVSRAALDRELRAGVEAGAPSLAVAIAKDGKLVWAGAAGLADRQLGVKATPRTVYRIGSVTKQFTAIMIMQAVREGKIRLDDPVGKHVPEVPEAWRPVTIRQLLNHTSGIPSYTSNPKVMTERLRFAAKPIDVVMSVKDTPMDFPPGAKWSYNNTGYVLLGVILERLDQQPYADSLAARILRPAGMTETYFVSEQRVVPRRATGYSNDRHADYLNMDWPHAAGSIESTVLDLAKYAIALRGTSLVTSEEKARMWAKGSLTGGEPVNYGFGWALGERNGQRIVDHSGGIHGFQAMMVLAPDRDVAIFALMNSDSVPPKAARFEPTRLASRLLEMVEPSLRIAPPKAIADPEPATSKANRAFLESIFAGKVDASALTKEFAEAMSPARVSQLAQDLEGLGSIRTFDLLEVSERPDRQIVRRYRVILGETETRFDVTRTSEGLIAGMIIRPA